MRDIAEACPLPCTVDAPDIDLGVREADALALAAREVVTNTLKHASATMIRITATGRAPSLSVVIADDGIGGAHRAGGSGLNGLAARLSEVSGTVRVFSPPGRGTRVEITLPMGAQNVLPSTAQRRSEVAMP